MMLTPHSELGLCLDELIADLFISEVLPIPKLTGTKVNMVYG
jgi:hypothetical protein